MGIQKKPRRKKYNAGEAAKRKSGFASFMDDTTDVTKSSADMDIRPTHYGDFSKQDKYALIYPRRWLITVAVTVKKPDGGVYVHRRELNFKTEHLLSSILCGLKEEIDGEMYIILGIDDIRDEILNDMNPNHTVTKWGWFAEQVKRK